jgi:hypothetical protein
MAKAKSASKKGSTKKSTKTGSASSKKSAKKPSAKKASAKKASAAKASSETAGSKAAAEKPAAAQESALPEGAQLPATRGKVGVFGGPKDRGIKPDDKLGLPTGPHFTFQRVHSLNPKGFYCAMRWDYRFQHLSPEEGKRWWANKKILVTNPQNGKAVVVRAVDYGPHENTGLDIGVSPGAAEALGVEVGDEVEINFADQKAPTGVVEEAAQDKEGK